MSRGIINTSQQLNNAARSGARLAINRLHGVSQNAVVGVGPVIGVPPSVTTTADPTTNEDVHVMIWDVDSWDDPNSVWM